MGTVFSYAKLLPQGGWFILKEVFKKKNISDEEKNKLYNGNLTINDIAKGIKSGKFKKIIVMTGAGLSTNAGIPDFRSSDGFYANVEKYNLSSPMDIFSIDFFKKNPKPFYDLCKDLLPKEKAFSPTFSHKFIQVLQDKGLLQRVWTQNIDGLEMSSGIKPKKMVEAHGHIRTAFCISCKKTHSMDWFKKKINNNEHPKCKFCKGLVKPSVTFFGEALPPRFFSLFMSDFSSCDLLIVCGTSLQVYPFAGLVDRVGWKVPRVLFNREAVGCFKYSKEKYRNVMMLGDLDVKTKEFMELLGWKGEIQKIEKELKEEKKEDVDFFQNKKEIPEKEIEEIEEEKEKEIEEEEKEEEEEN